MKTPAFQFYAQDFLTGVMYLTNEEIGIYIKMLSKQWTDGKIPKKRLGFLVGLEWDNFSEELKEKFIDKGDYLINERLEQERDKKDSFIEKQRNNGKRGGRPSKNQSNKKPKQNPDESQKKPLEDEDEIEEEVEVENEDEKKEKQFEKILNEFNSKCSELPDVQKLTNKRKSAISQRLRDDGIEKIFEVIDKTSKSAFLNGKSDKGWKANFDWIMSPNNFIKVIENNYKNKDDEQSNSNEKPLYGRQSEENIKKNMQNWGAFRK